MIAPRVPCQIDVLVRSPDELFERLDPTPVADRHLEEKVEQFIIHQAEEKRSAEYRLVVRIPGTASAPDAAEIASAIGHHFRHRAEEESARLRALIVDGRRDVMIGLLFLFVCGAAALFAVRVLTPTLGVFVEQGLLILGWVALWRPADLFLYDLRPIRRRRDLFAALSRMDVRFE